MEVLATVTRAGVPAFVAEFVDGTGARRRGPLSKVWATPFERVAPVRSFPSFRGQVSFTGLYYAATMNAHVPFPHMRAAGGGTIVNVSSVAGRRGWASASAYCATKFGLTGLTQALAAEGAPHGIRVVCLYPGAMATHWGTWDPAQRGQPRRAAPEDALPPDDVAGYIAWLVCAPAHLILAEAVVAPIRERGWP